MMTSSLTMFPAMLHAALFAVWAVIHQAMAQDTDTDAETTTIMVNQSANGSVSGVRYLSADERAALWACFFGGLMAMFGIWRLYYEYKFKKYEQLFPYPRKKKSKVPKDFDETKQ